MTPPKANARAGRRPVARLLLALVLATLACATPAAPQATPRATSPAPGPTSVAGATPRGATAAVAPFSGEAVSAALERLPDANAFAPFNAARGGASSLDPALPRSDLLDMEKRQSLQQLSAAQQEALLANGFVVDDRPFDSFAAAYAYGAEQKLPAFITTDAILHAFRVVADVAWQRSQNNALVADLQALSHNMVLVSQRQWEEAPDDAATQAALRNLAYFSVGSSLVDASFAAPAPVAQIVADELTLIAQGGRFISPLFGVEEDYARFRPTNAYAQDERLASYYRARAWFGRPLSFSYAPVANNTLEPLAEARLAARQALLMTWGLRQSDNLTRWQRIYEPALFFEGATSAWSIAELQAASDSIYGAEPALAALAAGEMLDDFLATMQTMPPSLPFDPTIAPAFSLLPAPAPRHEAAPDAAIIRQLTYNRVGFFNGAGPLPRTAVETAIGAIRGLPRTLDIAAVLQSPLAQSEIAAARDDAYDGYAQQFAQLQQQFDSIESAQWTRSFDGGWLYTLQPLLTLAPAGGFLYAPAEAWQARQLAGWHTAWLAMRHETTLAPRPVTSITISPEVAYGYLEPQPLLYARLAALTAQIREGLGARDLLDAESAAKLQQLERLLEAAHTIARKQLAGQRLSADEALLLSQFMSRLQALITYEPAPGSAVPQTDASLARLVDVYREPSSGKLLQAATGAAWPIYVLAPREQGVILTMGAILSSYELHGEQLSPGAWRDLEERPAPPDWLQPVIVGGAAP